MFKYNVAVTGPESLLLAFRSEAEKLGYKEDKFEGEKYVVFYINGTYCKYDFDPQCDYLFILPEDWTKALNTLTLKGDFTLPTINGLKVYLDSDFVKFGGNTLYKSAFLSFKPYFELDFTGNREVKYIVLDNGISISMGQVKEIINAIEYDNKMG